MARAVLALLCWAVCFCEALDAKWTPNGEAPAPFSTNARNAMGIDPAAFADGTTAGAPPKGAALRFNVGALLIVYLANNWKAVVALQEMILKLLGPLLGASAARSEAAAKLSSDAAKAAARKARVARLAAEAASKD